MSFSPNDYMDYFESNAKALKKADFGYLGHHRAYHFFSVAYRDYCVTCPELQKVWEGLYFHCKNNIGKVYNKGEKLFEKNMKPEPTMIVDELISLSLNVMIRVLFTKGYQFTETYRLHADEATILLGIYDRMKAQNINLPSARAEVTALQAMNRLG